MLCLYSTLTHLSSMLPLSVGPHPPCCPWTLPKAGLQSLSLLFSSFSLLDPIQSNGILQCKYLSGVEHVCFSSSGTHLPLIEGKCAFPFLCLLLFMSLQLMILFLYFLLNILTKWRDSGWDKVSISLRIRGNSYITTVTPIPCENSFCPYSPLHNLSKFYFD